MFDYDREYAEFKFRVEHDYTTAKEKTKIEKELALFEQLDWQKYIVLLPKVIQRIEEYAQYDDSYTIRDTDCSLFNTYAFLKFISQEFATYGFPRDYKNSKESLSKSAISLTFYIQPTGENLNFDHIARCLKPIIEECGLYCSQRILNNVTAPHLCDPTFQEALYIFSSSPIPISATDSLSKENRYLLIKFTVDIAKKEKDPYEELKSRALSACGSQEEANKVQHELARVEGHDWQQYLVVIARMLEKLEEEESLSYFPDFNVPCIFTIEKALGPNVNLSYGEISSCEDYFSARFTIMAVHENYSSNLAKIRENIKDGLEGLDLCKKSLTINEYIDAVIISTSRIRNEDPELFAKRFEECTLDEKEKLSKYLVIMTVHPNQNGGWN